VISPSPALPGQRYKRCPTCRRLTPAKSPRCYECWNDVAAVPVLDPDIASVALVRQVERDAKVAAQRVQRQRRWQRVRQATIALLVLATAWYGYRTFIYEPPPVPPGTQPELALATPPGTWPIDGADAGGSHTTTASTALLRNGAISWSRELNGEPGGPLIADGERVYATFQDGRVVALDARSGAPAWTHELATRPVASPTIADGRLYVPQVTGRLLVLDAVTGEAIIESAATTTSFTTSPLIADGIAYLFGSGRLLALDAATGELLWSQVIESNWAFVTPVLSGRHIAVATGNRTLIFDRIDGVQTYFYEFERAQPFSIVIADDTVYSLSARFGAAIDIESRRPWWEGLRKYWNQLWVWGMAKEPPPPPSLWVTRRPPRDGFPVAVAPDRLLVGGAGGDLRALSRDDGAPLWQVRTPAILDAPVLAADGLLVAHEHSIALYDPGDGQRRAERAIPGDANLASVIVTGYGAFTLAADGRLTALR
jgi:outer membrane protein assembly factor BamB